MIQLNARLRFYKKKEVIMPTISHRNKKLNYIE